MLYAFFWVVPRRLNLICSYLRKLLILVEGKYINNVILGGKKKRWMLIGVWRVRGIRD
jgi:hypothetical protein